MDIEKLKYPIGHFNPAGNNFNDAVSRIFSLPERLRAVSEGLSSTQLDTPYRDGGWTIRQVIHHLPDSHVNAYIRYKLAFTEQSPVIRPYDEVAWSECDDAKTGDIQLSLNLLEALHKRWVVFLSSLSESDLQRTYIHPANKKESTLLEAVGMYAWHGDHHLAHITTAIERNGW